MFQVKHKDLPDLEDPIEEERIPPVSKNNDYFVVQALKYCYHNRINFDARDGLKTIVAALQVLPMTPENSQDIKDFYESIDRKAYASGEYPYPSNFASYIFLVHAFFNEDCSDFTIDRFKKEFKSKLDKREYEQASELYYEKHHNDLEEEAEISDKEEKEREKAYYSKLSSVEDEMYYLKYKSGYDFPIGCELINANTHIIYQINTLVGYIYSLENRLHYAFDNQESKFGVEYKVSYKYFAGWEWDFKNNDPYKQAIDSLNFFLDIIENYDDTIRIENLKILKKNLLDRAKQLFAHYMNKIVISEKDQITVFQMIEDYFGTKGIDVVTIKPKSMEERAAEYRANKIKFERWLDSD